LLIIGLLCHQFFHFDVNVVIVCNTRHLLFRNLVVGRFTSWLAHGDVTGVDLWQSQRIIFHGSTTKQSSQALMPGRRLH
jgi:hypothetical protein